MYITIMFQISTNFSLNCITKKEKTSPQDTEKSFLLYIDGRIYQPSFKNKGGKIIYKNLSLSKI